MNLRIVLASILLAFLATPVLAADGEVAAAADEWENFDYQQVGLTQWEFQQVREAAIPKDKLLHMLELGVRPAEYLQKPWETLGVTETEWLDQRSRGMEDGDIDRSYRNKAVNQDLAYWSLVVPGLYQWKTGNYTYAISMDILWVASVAGFTWLSVDTPEKDEMYFIAPLLLVHAWSFGDAFWKSRWENNPDANRFSWGVTPTFGRGVAGLVQLSF